MSSVTSPGTETPPGTSVPASPSAANANNKPTFNPGVIVGIAIVSLLVFSGVALILLIFWRRMRRKRAGPVISPHSDLDTHGDAQLFLPHRPQLPSIPSTKSTSTPHMLSPATSSGRSLHSASSAFGTSGTSHSTLMSEYDALIALAEIVESPSSPSVAPSAREPIPSSPLTADVTGSAPSIDSRRSRRRARVIREARYEADGGVRLAGGPIGAALEEEEVMSEARTSILPPPYHLVYGEAMSSFAFVTPANPDHPALAGDLDLVQVLPASHNSSHSAASPPSQPPPEAGFFRTSSLRGGSLSSTNRSAFNINLKVGKQLGPSLVDDTGMGGRLHQIHPSAFLDTVPGPEPTLTQRRSFVKPVVGKEVNSERKLAVIFVRVLHLRITSMKTDSRTLRVVDTASHKATQKDGDNQPTDTLNDVGFYLESRHSRAATDLNPEQRQHSKIPQSKREARNLGCQSWHWLVIPVELKWSAIFASYAKGKSSNAESKGASDGQQGNTARAPSADVGSNEGHF
ncbi:hypothetical protein ONZ51_g12861 [Trametes cubensis]|uniref:Uncharacterized protein n=1 Tax=Trametes cubensis TaxID=1111947 RepID=A0AAD7X3D0_9APHY|nr:hypothetical protein ONZ51_g12861 [Trametes cubensis]